MTIEQATKKVISVAENEEGYLEKASNSNLDSKTGNPGSANYTKYWRDVYPAFQGQAWCAAFVSWIFMTAFGLEYAKKLLKHWPYTYCPTMASLFTLNANPKVGDIVIFYRNGVFAHTGIVISVNGDQFTTIEGNTSGGSTIVSNGGGVYRKSYYNSALPGTKFCTPDYSIVSSVASSATSVSTSASTDTNIDDTTLTTIAKYINAEFGCASGSNYNCLLGVAQCMYDMWKNGGYGKSLSEVLKNNFTTPSSTYTKECLQAATDVFVNGKMRYSDKKILQFRSFSAYGDGNGNPDPIKCASLLAKYKYIGSDSISPSLGHLYFGECISSQSSSPNKSLNNSVKYNLKTKKECPVRTWAGKKYPECSFSPLPIGTTVQVCDEVKSSAGNDWYYVLYNDKYGFCYKNNFEARSLSNSSSYTVQVTAEALNVRSEPSVSGNIVNVITDKGIYTIIEENNGWGKLKSGLGWICLDYTQRT